MAVEDPGHSVSLANLIVNSTGHHAVAYGHRPMIWRHSGFIRTVLRKNTCFRLFLVPLPSLSSLSLLPRLDLKLGPTFHNVRFALSCSYRETHCGDDGDDNDGLPQRRPSGPAMNMHTHPQKAERIAIWQPRARSATRCQPTAFLHSKLDSGQAARLTQSCRTLWTKRAVELTGWQTSAASLLQCYSRVVPLPHSHPGRPVFA